MVFIKDLVVSSAEGIFGKGMKCPILEKRSRITITQVKPLEIGRLVIKSIEIEVQEWLGMSSGCKRSEKMLKGMDVPFNKFLHCSRGW